MRDRSCRVKVVPPADIAWLEWSGEGRGEEWTHTRATRSEKFRKKGLLGLLGKAAARRESCSWQDLVYTSKEFPRMKEWPNLMQRFLKEGYREARGRWESPADMKQNPEPPSSPDPSHSTLLSPVHTQNHRARQSCCLQSQWLFAVCVY